MNNSICIYIDSILKIYENKSKRINWKKKNANKFAEFKRRLSDHYRKSNFTTLGLKLTMHTVKQNTKNTTKLLQIQCRSLKTKEVLGLDCVTDHIDLNML